MMSSPSNHPRRNHREAPQRRIIAIITGVAIGIVLGLLACVPLLHGRLSSSSGLASVPNVQGLSQEDASSALSDAGLIVGTVTEASSDSISQGYVISQSPTANSGVAKGTAVDLVISSGTLGDSHTYTLVSQAMTWQEAEAYCESEGGHLATVTSADEYQQVLDTLGNSGTHLCWLGARRSGATWEWVTGEALAYTAWAPGEPSDDGGGDYLALLRSSTDGWGWYNLPATGSDRYTESSRGFVMEVDGETPLTTDDLTTGTASSTGNAGVTTTGESEESAANPYDAVLEAYRAALASDSQPTSEYVNAEAWLARGSGNFGYATPDLNGDGTDELLVGRETNETSPVDGIQVGYHLYDLYTLQDKTPVRIADPYSLGYRSIWIPCEDSMFEAWGSGGATYYTVTIYRLDTGASTPTEVASATYDGGTWTFEDATTGTSETLAGSAGQDRYDSLMSGYSPIRSFDWTSL